MQVVLVCVYNPFISIQFGLVMNHEHPTIYVTSQADVELHT
jgi:hypothetical protein